MMWYTKRTCKRVTRTGSRNSTQYTDFRFQFRWKIVLCSVLRGRPGKRLQLTALGCKVSARVLEGVNAKSAGSLVVQGAHGLHPQQTRYFNATEIRCTCSTCICASARPWILLKARFMAGRRRHGCFDRFDHIIDTELRAIQYLWTFRRAHPQNIFPDQNLQP